MQQIEFCLLDFPLCTAHINPSLIFPAATIKLVSILQICYNIIKSLSPHNMLPTGTSTLFPALSEVLVHTGVILRRLYLDVRRVLEESKVKGDNERLPTQLSV